MQLCLHPKVKVKMFSQSHFLCVLLIILVSFSFSFSSDPENPLVVHDLHRHHRTRRLQSPSAMDVTVNVDSFGAKGDGSDDSQAFTEAWKKACSSKSDVELVVPRNRVYQLKPMDFSGPCKSQVTLKIYGTIEASAKQSDYKDSRHWILFSNLTNFRVEGGGTIDGNGRKWWQSSCKVDDSHTCTTAPNAVTFLGCNTLEVDNLKFRDAQKMHLSFESCVNVKASNLIVTAPGDSPNTDGIHVSGTQNIGINNCLIRTGDDCISIVSGSKTVRVEDITCGPGHGISIGSLGAGNSQAEVSDVMVSRANLMDTTNGLRIKTWQGGSGYATNIRFKNVVMANVSNPIIIDQHYCDQDKPCLEQDSAVEISNVLYENVKGTSASKVAVKFDCSKDFRCQEILLKDVNLKPLADETAQASCENVSLNRIGTVSPTCS
ncbi:hypothetical protein FF1_028590 [Malus domestica]